MASNFVELLKRRTREGLNTNIIIIGAPRSGKSRAALRLGEAISDRFTIKNIAWTIPQFVANLNHPDVIDNDVLIFDEVGVGAKARRWYTEQNNKFIDILQTWGWRHLTSIMTTPSLDYVDSGARKLFHYLIETTPKHDFREGWIRAKVRAIKYDPKSGKVYYPALIFNGRKKVFTKIKTASPLLTKQYDEASELWKKNLENEINRSFVEEEVATYSNEQLTEKILLDKKNYIQKYRGRQLVKKEILRDAFGITDARALVVKDMVERRLLHTRNVKSVT